VKVPPLRKICNEYIDEFLSELSASPKKALSGIAELLHGEYHEYREAALLMLAHACKLSRARRPKVSAEAEDAIFNFYLANTEYINNWDLVDCSAPYIVGGHLLDKPRDILYSLADSTLLWDQRISIVSCLTFIRKGDLKDIFSLADIFIKRGKMHDLMQKAIGWMLREAGKADENALLAFLDAHASAMPRTMLRYSLERLSPAIRQHYMTVR
jgi:3-methyladenine DNA glycosylase AlkD